MLLTTSDRGDNVNGFDVNDRTPDPDRLLQAYFHSSTTLNHIRGLLDSGFADLHAPFDFSFEHVRNSSLQQSYEEIVDSITDALDFMKTVGADPQGSAGSGGTLNRVDYFVSHEGLMLEYEEALTREVAEEARSGVKEGHYNLSTHLLWLGDRTRALEGAHIEYFRGIKNPIGIKVGPSMKPEELVKLLDLVDPDHLPGRVVLIGRFGASKVSRLRQIRGRSWCETDFLLTISIQIASCLPPLIKAVQNSPHAASVIWTSDPMHGNTISPASHPSIKTRRFEDIVSELSAAFTIHEECGSRLGGAHLELTGEVDEAGESVTECTGGSMELTNNDLEKRYLVSHRKKSKSIDLLLIIADHPSCFSQTHCDPRLNAEQSLDVAFLISHALKHQRLAKRSGGSRTGSMSREPSTDGRRPL